MIKVMIKMSISFTMRERWVPWLDALGLVGFLSRRWSFCDGAKADKTSHGPWNSAFPSWHLRQFRNRSQKNSMKNAPYWYVKNSVKCSPVLANWKVYKCNDTTVKDLKYSKVTRDWNLFTKLLSRGNLLKIISTWDVCKSFSFPNSSSFSSSSSFFFIFCMESYKLVL